MTISLTRRASTAALFATLTGAGVARAQPASAAIAQDRRAILAMAGDYKVRFNFRETVSFLPDYRPLEPKTSGGHEVVRVIEDTPERISLQHILVVDAEGKTVLVKHWRQDWTYEPRSVLTYAGPSRWNTTAVDRTARRGAWSQTVWQTDDSPRYGGVGRWTHERGVSIWTSGASTRPLARRDAIRNPPYKRYDCVNRHALTPTGWVHEQENVKIGPRDGGETTFVHEDGWNTYDRFAEFDVAAADNYWRDTKEYWAVVRGAWDAAIAEDSGVSVEEEPNAGSVTGERLMGLADKIHARELETAAANTQARAIIAESTKPRSPTPRS